MDSGSTANKSLMSIVGGWFRSGVVEISSASKVGHIRLMLNGLTSDKNRIAQQMGLKIYSMLGKGELKIPQVEDLFLELRQIDKTITVREAEIEQINKEKEVRLLEASGVTVAPSWSKEPPKARRPVAPVAKKAPVKKAASPSEAVKKKTAGKRVVTAKRAGRKKTAVGRAAKSSKVRSGKKKTVVKAKPAARKRLVARKKPVTGKRAVKNTGVEKA